MLDFSTSISGMNAVKDYLYSKGEDFGCKFSTEVFVQDDLNSVVLNDSIDIIISEATINYYNVNIIWEDSGYKDYREKGLFGYYSTSYQEMIYEEEAGLKIESSNGQTIFIR